MSRITLQSIFTIIFYFVIFSNMSYACDQYPYADITTPDPGDIYIWIKDPYPIYFSGTGTDPDNGTPEDPAGPGDGITQCQWWFYSYAQGYDYLNYGTYASSSTIGFNFYNTLWHDTPGHYEMELYVVGDDSHDDYYDFSYFDEYYDHRDIYAIEGTKTFDEYIVYGTGTDISYNIAPNVGWSFDEAWLCITPCAYPFYTAYETQIYDFGNTISWDGKGNNSPYDGIYLPIGSYVVGLWIFPSGGNNFFIRLGYINIIDVDLDTDINVDGIIDEENDDDPYETDPGGYIAANGDRKLIKMNVEPVNINYDYEDTIVWVQITYDNADIYTAQTGGNNCEGDITWYLDSYYDRVAFNYYINNGLYIQATNASASLKDIEVALIYYDSYSCTEIDSDTVNFTAIKTGLLVNNTESQTDDYLVLQKPEGIRPDPMLNPGQTAGPNDNHIPTKIHLEGPTGFSCIVKLTDSGGGTGVGDITIKKADGSSYPSGGVTVTVGTDLDVKIYGTTASSNLNDVSITAKTDKTGDSICKQEDLTVIWISGSNMNFRGSNQQDQSLTSCSAVKFHKPTNVFEDKVGKFNYLLPYNGLFKQYSFRNQMEISNQISPNKDISDVVWDIKREVNRVKWGPGSGTLPPMYIPIGSGSGWYPDDNYNTDEDLEQNTDCLNIFVIDNPGEEVVGSVNDAGKRYIYKAKFHEWVQVTIGGKVYVCSPYVNWRSIIHTKCPDNTTGWIWDTTKTTEIVTGTIDGWAETWSED
jgi:hypothetical protein